MAEDQDQVNEDDDNEDQVNEDVPEDETVEKQESKMKKLLSLIW